MHLPTGRLKLVKGEAADLRIAGPEAVGVRRLTHAELSELPVGPTGVASPRRSILALVPVLEAVPQNLEVFEQFRGEMRKADCASGRVEVVEGSYEVAGGHKAKVGLGTEIPERESLFVVESTRDALLSVGLQPGLKGMQLLDLAERGPTPPQPSSESIPASVLVAQVSHAGHDRAGLNYAASSPMKG